MIGNVNQPSTAQIMDVDGTLKTGAVDVEAVLADNVVTAAKIADNVVGAGYSAGSDLTLEAASDRIGAAASASGSIGTSIDTDGTLKAGAVDLAAVVADNVITNAKLAADIKIGSLAALTTRQKDSIQNAMNETKALACFDRYSGSQSVVATALRVLPAIRAINIFGSDANKPHKVFSIARNSATNRYRIMIDIYDGGIYKRLIDTGTAFEVTENPNGLTYVRIDPADNVDGQIFAYGQSAAGAELLIDYSALGDTETYYLEDIENHSPNYVIRADRIDGALTREYEHNLWHVFTGYPDTNRRYTTIGGGLARRAIIDMAIYGSDPAKVHKIWLIGRGPGDPQGWRIIIYRNDGTAESPTWTKIIDPTDDFVVTENTGGITCVYISADDNTLGLANVSGRFWIDYQYLEPSTSYNFDNSETGDPVLSIRPRCIFSSEYGNSAFDQNLNTSDAVTFASLATTGNIQADGDVSGGAANFTAFQVSGTLPTGTLASPPAGLEAGDMWADTTDSATHPILRVKA